MQNEGSNSKIKNFFNNLKTKFLNYFKTHTKRKVILILVAIVVLFFVLKPKGINPDLITVTPVQSQNLVSSVKASGKITSTVDLSLSFKTADMVSRVNVVVGQKVKAGQVLATLESGNESAAVTQAMGGLRSARATLQKVKEGATGEELRVTQTAYDNAVRDLEKVKKTQDSLVENAKRSLYSQYLESVPDTASTTSVAPVISGTYSGDTDATYKISVYSTGSGAYYSVSGASISSAPIDLQTPKPLGSDGLFITFPSGFVNTGSGWTVSVPNKSSAYYTTNYNAYLSAKQNRDLATSQAQSLVDARKADLDLKIAGARTADVEIAEANVTVAEGAYQNALANLEKKILRSPADATVTKVDIKVGEQASSMVPVVVVQDVGKLYVEADINESSIKNVQEGQSVLFSIDAFGSAQIFKGFVTQVEPGATITDGIVNYKVKTSIEVNDSIEYKNIKPGMNANITITTGTKEGVVAVPGATIEKRDGKNYVKIITNEKNKKYIEREVTTGIIGDGNMTEITSGLSVGENVALIQK
jgi:multidrug efflux pump subunit AcrA (membrane-fusion protein)